MVWCVRLLLVLFGALVGTTAAAWAQTPSVLTVRIDGAITPVVADHVGDAVQQAETGGHEALLVEVDTPGGLVTSMREIVQSFLGADVPVIAYAASSGARAASAGAVSVNAVTYFNVTDPVKSVVSVEEHVVATSQIAQTTLRSILGQGRPGRTADQPGGDQPAVAADHRRGDQPVGRQGHARGGQALELPDTMRRAMARQAEAERERRAKVIHAHGELEAAETLGQAAETLERHPAAMQLVDTMRTAIAEPKAD